MTTIAVDRVRASGFSLTEELPLLQGSFHEHRKHQLLYASHGTMQLELDDARWFLPPARAAWIRAGTAHRVRVTSACRLSTVYLSARLVRERLGDALPHCRVFNLSSLGRALIVDAERWGPARSPSDARANRFFEVLVDYLGDWLAAEQTFMLPRAKRPELARALTYAHRDLAAATAEGAARAAGMSTRTLARSFRDELGTTWRHYLHAARMLHAMELLGDRRRVTDVAVTLGFDSLSAFSGAFRRFTGQSPRDFAKAATHDRRSSGRLAPAGGT